MTEYTVRELSVVAGALAPQLTALAPAGGSFPATYDWQYVPEGSSLPAGLEVAMPLDGGRTAVEHAVEHSSTARRVVSPGGRLPIDVLLGLGAATETLIASRKSHHEMEHEDGEEHDHDDFASFVVETGPVADPAPVLAAVAEVVARHDILRLKGFLDVENKPMRLVVQGVGRRFTSGFDRLWQPGERASRFVVIGQSGLDEAAIRAEIQAAARETVAG